MAFGGLSDSLDHALDSFQPLLGRFTLILFVFTDFEVHELAGIPIRSNMGAISTILLIQATHRRCIIVTFTLRLHVPWIGLPTIQKAINAPAFFAILYRCHRLLGMLLYQRIQTIGQLFGVLGLAMPELVGLETLRQGVRAIH